MAQFDTSTIENFDSMTPEQKVEALLKAEIPEKVDMSGFISKELFDRKASEAANLSKQLKERLSEDEKKKMADEESKRADDERYTALEEKYNELLKRSTIAEYKGKFLGQGMDEKMAVEAATALADNDTTKLFDIQQKFQEQLKKRIEAELVKGTKKPDGSGGDDGGDGVSPALERAKRIGTAKATANKESADVLSKYIKH